ncbi:hypothetical protein DNC80_01650 [Flavobacterium sp. SOK18b]|nr:hypothetical protein [Flavobacterium sp. SOK18b]
MHFFQNHNKQLLIGAYRLLNLNYCLQVVFIFKKFLHAFFVFFEGGGSAFWRKLLRHFFLNIKKFKICS